MGEERVKYGRIVTLEGRKELWMRFAMRRFPELVEEYKVLSWRMGRSNVVMSVPHAGTVGSDITPVGNIICQSGHVIETRKGNMEFPIKTLVGDAGTDQIAEGVRELMAQDGLEPHVIELHMHRSKVEPNSKLEEMGVQTVAHESAFIHNLYHSWISQALEMGRKMPMFLLLCLLISMDTLILMII